MISQIDNFIVKPIQWLTTCDENSDVVISTRIRLARNVKDTNFPEFATKEKLEEVIKIVINGIESNKLLADKHILLNMPDLTPLDKQFLFERHLISREHSQNKLPSYTIIESNEKYTIMVNEEDHLRIQAIVPSFKPEEAWQIVEEVDDLLSESIPYAFSDTLGYLTACPTNVGTGMRISCLLHLPAITYTGQFDKVFQALFRTNFSVRGLYGEGSKPSGEFYQISNRITLGKSETELIDDMRKLIPEIIKFERTTRQKMLEDRDYVENKILRAYGMLAYATTVTTKELLDLLSLLRLGIYLGIIHDVDVGPLTELIVLSQPSHIQKLSDSDKELSQIERDKFRAKLVKSRLLKK